MNTERARQIFQSLVEGMNPFNGKDLPKDSLLRQAELIRALLLGIDLLQQEEKRTTGAGSPVRENVDAPWTESEIAKLVEESNSGHSIAEMALTLGRTVRSIQQRLEAQGLMSGDLRIAGPPVPNLREPEAQTDSAAAPTRISGAEPALLELNIRAAYGNEQEWQETRTKAIDGIVAVGRLYGDDEVLMSAKAEFVCRMLRAMVEKCPCVEFDAEVPRDLNETQLQTVRAAIQKATIEGVGVCLTHNVQVLMAGIFELCTSKLTGKRVD